MSLPTLTLCALKRQCLGRMGFRKPSPSLRGASAASTWQNHFRLASFEVRLLLAKTRYCRYCRYFSGMSPQTRFKGHDFKQLHFAAVGITVVQGKHNVFTSTDFGRCKWHLLLGNLVQHNNSRRRIST